MEWPGQRISTGPQAAIDRSQEEERAPRVRRLGAGSNAPAEMAPSSRLDLRIRRAGDRAVESAAPFVSGFVDTMVRPPVEMLFGPEDSDYEASQGLAERSQAFGTFATEMTGLPSIARGAGALTGFGVRAARGNIDPQNYGQAAWGAGEMALGLLPYALAPVPRGAGRPQAPLQQMGREVAPPIELGPPGENMAYMDLPLSRQTEAVQQAVRDSVRPRVHMAPLQHEGREYGGAWRVGGQAITQDETLFGLGPQRYRVHEGIGPRGPHGYDRVKRVGSFPSLDEASQFVLERYDPRLDDLARDAPGLTNEWAARGVQGARYRARSADGDRGAWQVDFDQPRHVGGESFVPPGLPQGEPRPSTPRPIESGGNTPLVGGTPEALARAREQGWRPDSYHASTNNVEGALRPSMSGHLGPGVYVAHRPETTETFVGGGRVWDEFAGESRPVPFSQGANIMPLATRGRIATFEQYADALEKARRRFHRRFSEDQDVREAAAADLRAQGFTGARDEVMDFTVMFADPDGQVRNIRSRFAAFDPAKRDSSDLLAAFGLRSNVGANASAQASGQAPSYAPPARLLNREMTRPRGQSGREWRDVRPRIEAAEQRLQGNMQNAISKGYGGDEWATDIRPGRRNEWTTDGDPYAVSIDGSTDGIIVHNHPHEAVDDLGYQAPFGLSGDDISTLVGRRQGRNFLGITSVEPGGGRGFAVSGPRAHKIDETAWQDAADAAVAAARKDPFGVDFAVPNFGPIPEDELIAQFAMGEAMRRQRVLSQYGYRPGTAAQEATLGALEPNMRRAVGASYRALHKPIHGLPYPITWPGIALAAAGAGAIPIAAALTQNRQGRPQRLGERRREGRAH